ASGVLPDGAAFNGLMALTDALSGDERLIDCAAEKLLTYALSRQLVKSDAPYVKQIREHWEGEGLGLRELLQQIVLNDTFRYRRGEAQ
ncbi:MAG TPA: DUF1585 domain-containing protein, partial [Polyangiaceae bacterium]|nr:DUF1585 domain-containing protein [Polyangiaceae bacterium]